MPDSFSTKVTIGDREVTVYELSVREVRNLVNSTVANGDNDYINNALVEDAPFAIIAGFTDVTVEQLEDWRPSEIRALRDECRKYNPDFFELNRRVEKALALAATAENSLIKTSHE